MNHIPLKKERCYAKSSTVQDAFQPIVDLISHAGGNCEMGTVTFTSRPNTVRWLALSIRQYDSCTLLARYTYLQCKQVNRWYSALLAQSSSAHRLSYTFSIVWYHSHNERHQTLPYHSSHSLAVVRSIKHFPKYQPMILCLTQSTSFLLSSSSLPLLSPSSTLPLLSSPQNTIYKSTILKKINIWSP